MLGGSLCAVLRRRGHEVIATDRQPLLPETRLLDICDRPAVLELMTAAAPALVMHLAAETDVDRCEQEPAHAYRVNAAGTEHLVAACEAAGARLLYTSTAAVFDGEQAAPYAETDAPNPVNVYARTKLAGEVAVRRCRTGSVIVRAGWMVGGFERDKKFVGKLLRLMETQRELSVVQDKRGSLTFTEDLAQGIAGLIATPHTGLFHMVNQGVCTRYDIARKLVEYVGRPEITIRPVSSAAFPLPAPRGASEAIRNVRLQALGLDTMPPWEASLRRYVEQYLAASRTVPAR